MSKLKGNKLWRDRKRLWCGLPWTFTIYSLDDERLYVETGILSKREDECRLYRVLDISLSRSFGQRLFGLGTIEVHSSDRTLKDFQIKNIKHSHDVKELISRQVEVMRDKKRVSSREFIGDGEHDGYDDDDDDYNDNN
jgi:uncharacterized membrane protein YdbT with pleckstrin-like domain